MQRFIEEQNIAGLERLLATEALSDRSRHLLEGQWLAAQRRLATLMAANAGFKSRGRMARERAAPQFSPKLTGRFLRQFEATPMPLLLLDPGPGLHIVDANHDYTSATMTDAGRVAGQKLFDVFPDNPGDPFADGAANLFDSLRIVTETGRSHAMAVQRYDVRGPTGRFVERHWQPFNSPVFDAHGELAFILHRALDVSARFSAAGRGASPHAPRVRVGLAERDWPFPVEDGEVTLD